MRLLMPRHRARRRTSAVTLTAVALVTALAYTATLNTIHTIPTVTASILIIWAAATINRHGANK